MTLKLALAAVLRAIRSERGRTQEELTGASSRTYLGALEQGKSSVTLEKLYALSSALDVSPLTLIALCASTHEGQSVDVLVERMNGELLEFKRRGGFMELNAQIQDGALVPRRPGKRSDAAKLERVRACKAAGMTQKQTAVELGLSTSTVHDLWKRGEEA